MFHNRDWGPDLIYQLTPLGFHLMAAVGLGGYQDIPQRGSEFISQPTQLTPNTSLQRRGIS